MATVFFSDTQVGKWSDNTPILGTLTGSVSRTGNTVALNYTLVLYAPTPVTGTKQLVFSLGGIGRSLPLVGQSSAYLGTFSYVLAFPVSETQTSEDIAWSTSDGFSGSFTVTFPAPPAKPTVNAYTDLFYGELNVFYSVSSFGSPSTGIVTLYGDTNPNPTTVLDTNNTTYSKSVRLTDLKPSTTYYFKAVADNGQMSTSSDVVSITTKKESSFYVPVNGIARKTKKLYCSVDGKTKLVKKFYGSVNGRTRRIL